MLFYRSLTAPTLCKRDENNVKAPFIKNGIDLLLFFKTAKKASLWKPMFLTWKLLPRLFKYSAAIRILMKETEQEVFRFSSFTISTLHPVNPGSGHKELPRDNAEMAP